MVIERSEFEAFMREVEPRLRAALVSLLGPLDGRNAAVDALSFAWENFEEVKAMRNPAGYLYRVGARAASRNRTRDVLFEEPPTEVAVYDQVCIEPRLAGALSTLSERQRLAVILIHVYGYTLRDAAEILAVSRSTLHLTARRGLRRLAHVLREQHDVT